MKWFVIAEHDLTTGNAVSTHVLEVCNSLAKFENVTLISFSSAKNLPENANYQIQTLKPFKCFSETISTIINTLRVFFYLLGQRKRIDILYVRAAGLSIGPTLYSLLTHTRCITEINGIWLEEQKLSRSNIPNYKLLYVGPIHFIRHLSLLFMAKKASHLVVVTPQILEFLQKYGIRSDIIHVIHNGVNTEHFRPREITTSKEKLNLNKNIEFFCYVGSLSAWQGLEDLIAALGINRSKIHYKLMIVGDGAGLPGLKDLVTKQGLENFVFFTGAQPYKVIPEYITACRFMVSPKKNLKSGYSSLKVYECLACGRPLIVPKVAGLNFISRQNLGLTYDPNDINMLSQCILKMQNLTEGEWRQISTRARETALREFSWDDTAERIRNIPSSDAQ